MKKLVISLIIIVFISGCIGELPPKEKPKSIEDGEPITPYISTENEQITQDIVGGGNPSLPISVGLSISNAPALGESAELTFTITSLFRYNVSNFSGRIILSEGLEHVSGNLSWEGNLLPNQTVQFSAVVKAVKTGTWLVRASPQVGYGDQLHLLISEDSAQVSKNPFPADSRLTSRRMAVSVNDTEVPSQPPSNSSGISEEPASPDQVNP